MIASTGYPSNDNLMELLLMITTLRRASANRIVAIIPYFGYMRQLNQHTRGDTPIAGKTIADMLEAAGCDQIVTVEVHRPQAQGFFEHIPLEVLTTTKAAVPYFLTKKLYKPVILTTSQTSQARAKSFHDELILHGVDASMAVLYSSNKEGFVDSDESHHKAMTDSSTIVGKIANRDALLIDDMIDTGSRVTKAAQALRNAGVNRIYSFATHGLFSNKCLEKIEKDGLVNEVVVFNTLPIPSHKWNPLLTQLSCGKLIAKAIKAISNNQSLSDLNN